MAGTVRGTFDLNVPARHKVRELRTDLELTERQAHATGRALDGLGDQQQRRRLELHQREVRGLSRDLSEGRRETARLSRSLDDLGRKRVRPHIELGGIAEANRELDALDRRLDRLDRRMVSPGIAGAGGGGRGGGGRDGGMFGGVSAGGGPFVGGRIGRRALLLGAAGPALANMGGSVLGAAGGGLGALGPLDLGAGALATALAGLGGAPMSPCCPRSIPASLGHSEPSRAEAASGEGSGLPTVLRSSANRREVLRLGR